MDSVIILGDEEASSSPLSQQQRDRISKQKELAVARRNARLSASPRAFRTVIDITDSPEAIKPSLIQPLETMEVIDLGDSDTEVTEANGSKFRYFRASPIGNPATVRNLAGDGNWRQVRKRQSFEDLDRCKEVKRLESDHESAAVVKEEEKVTLSSEQLKVLEAVSRNQSVFVTGSAGTGKSHIVELAIKVMKTLHGGSGVYVTASTGIAACSISGTTLHSFAGVGIGTMKVDSLVGMVLKSKEKRRKWTTAKALVIDEISMIDAELFDKIDVVGRAVKQRPDKPFGGLQLLVTGDFFQLPPVQAKGETKSFVFNAKCWKDCFDLQIELTQVFRQKDQELVDMLNEVRRGDFSFATEQRLKACKTISLDLGIQPTRLFPRRDDVDRVNAQQLKELKEAGKEIVTYYANDFGKTEFLNSNRAEREVTLVEGAQVMLLKNLSTEAGLVNGARGVLIRFVPPLETKGEAAIKMSPGGGWPVVRFACEGGKERVVGPEGWGVMEGEVEVAKRMQIPLMLAWALSIHKCQGMTLDCLETDLSRSFEYGMVYVALSRVRSLEGLRLLGFDPRKIKAHPQVIAFYERLKNSSNFQNGSVVFA